ncbi:DUF554 domain-containing protein [Phormidium sp. CLA17]|uniref:DUF554 domain-containing protein n=1 Tax=Leptolyngbya sp. Cla-17 TaxID=2803751 RepID=UPI001490F91C|nr:DUF554 domain-containing protein [Leptolyngbya sp. Cla-17]MBM0743720.1 DUF554 domain-containing protein [Leptolyngbya sp. Cla-17]
MTLDFWAKTSGTWINVLAIALGTAAGSLLRGRLPFRMISVITQGVGLLTAFLGFTMAGNLIKVQAGWLDGIVLGLIALVSGGLLGEWAQIEERLTALGDRLKHQFSGDSRFTEGFVAASLLFCVGPMAILGSLSNGLSGDNRILLLKSTMDGLTAIAFTSSFGIGVGFSALMILLYQGSLSLLAGILAQIIPDPTTAPPILLTTGVGGLMIVGIGFNLLDIAKIRIAAFLPALLIAPVLYQLAIAILTSSLFYLGIFTKTLAISAIKCIT